MKPSQPFDGLPLLRPSGVVVVRTSQTTDNTNITVIVLMVFFFFFCVFGEKNEKSRLRGSNSSPNVSEGYMDTSELPGRPVTGNLLQ